MLEGYERLVKAGIPGVAIVRTDPDMPWPEEFAVKLPPRNG